MCHKNSNYVKINVLPVDKPHPQLAKNHNVTNHNVCCRCEQQIDRNKLITKESRTPKVLIKMLSCNAIKEPLRAT